MRFPKNPALDRARVEWMFLLDEDEETLPVDSRKFLEEFLQYWRVSITCKVRADTFVHHLTSTPGFSARFIKVVNE